MNRNPHERSNSARRQELRSEEETFRLQQEEGRLESGKRRSIFAWIINSIYLLVGMLEILLMLRFFLRFSRSVIRLDDECSVGISFILENPSQVLVLPTVSAVADPSLEL